MAVSADRYGRRTLRHLSVAHRDRTIAIEALYGDMEFETGALLYTMLASVVAYVLNGLFVGWRPLFQVSATLSVTNLSDYAWYATLGGASGLIATLLPVVFYRLREAFHALLLPPHIKPAIGGLRGGSARARITRGFGRWIWVDPTSH
jgi:H+/Cl- antiporter ClcA